MSAKRVIGFLPVTAREGEVSIDVDSEMIGSIAMALSAFVPGEVGVIGDWRGWQRPTEASGVGPREAPADRGRSRREGGWRSQQSDGWWTHPGVVPVVPAPAPDRTRASVALREAISVQPDRMSRLLVNLSDFASAGVVPRASEWMDGVALLVNVRRARWKEVARLVAAVPVRQQLGIIMLPPRAPPADPMSPG